MRCLYYCTTPLQILNAMNLHYNCTIYPTSEVVYADIAIVDKFRDAKEIYCNLKEEKNFNAVYLINEEDRKCQKNKLRKALGIAVDLILPTRLLRQQYGKEIMPRLKENYDFVVSSFFSHSIAALLTVNPNAEYIMMDDGIATYFGHWTNRLRSKGYLILLKIVNKGKDISIPKTLYVFRPEMCNTEMTNHILPLPELTGDFVNYAKRIFNTHKSNCEYKESIVWLSHVSNNNDKLKGTKIISNILRPYKNDIIVKLHPREEKLGCYSDYKLDDTGSMWELQLNNIESGDKLFITLGSTGVFTPKFLYNQEPWLLFTYKLIKLPNGTKINDYYKIIDRLKKNYSCPERICEPESWEEFENFIKAFLKYINKSH